MGLAHHTLTSARLWLRPVAGRDVAALHRHWTDPNVRRYLWDGEVIARDQVVDLVAQSERSFGKRGYGLWAIRRFEEDGLIGCGGYWEFHDPPRLELLLSLSPDRWGRGYAAEAGHLLIQHAFGALGFPEVRASTDAPNESSLRLARRLGFQYSRRAEGEGLDTVFFVLPREAYLPT